jgi:hypothetical protein
MSSSNKNVPVKNKKADKLTIIIYIVLVIFALYFIAAMGTALDLSVGNSGKIQFNTAMNKLTQTFTAPVAVFTALGAGGYTPKMLLFGIMAIGIFALYKYSQAKRRFHRRGVEHGSAEWGV